ncbi:hypothetical protein D3C81_770500 [compost metagenome]
MEERRVGFLVRLGQCHPGLHAVYCLLMCTDVGGSALGMGDATTGGHPVHITGEDHLFRAERIAVADLPGPQEGHRRQADMRMRPHVDALAGVEDGRPHVVHEHEWPDAACLQRGHRATDLEAAEVMNAWADDGGHACLRGGNPGGRMAWVVGGRRDRCGNGLSCLGGKQPRTATPPQPSPSPLAKGRGPSFCPLPLAQPRGGAERGALNSLPLA